MCLEINYDYLEEEEEEVEENKDDFFGSVIKLAPFALKLGEKVIDYFSQKEENKSKEQEKENKEKNEKKIKN